MTLQELGQSIREKREAAGLSIDDVASRIKISARILRTIEEGSLVGLPHAVYTKSFIRSFGLMVGYAPEELNEHLEELFPADSLDESKNESILHKQIALSAPSTGRRLAAMFVFLLILGSLIGGTWYVVANYGEAIIDLVKQPFSAVSVPPAADGSTHQDPVLPTDSLQSSEAMANALIALTGAPAGEGPGIPEPAPAPPVGVGDAPSSFPGAPASAGVVASAPPEAAASEAEAALEMPAPLENAAGANGKNQVFITAQQACWMSSRADGARGRDYTLQPNERFVLTYTDSLELTLGNAGGVTIEHNGRDLGKPGRAGQRVVLKFPEQQTR